MWKERGTNLGQPALAEIPDEESAGSSKRARLEESLDDEPEKMGEDDTSRIRPEETLMTKNPGRPPHQPVLSWTNASMTERVQWDEWATHRSVKIHSLVEATKMRQQDPRERRLHSRYAYRNKNAGLLDPAGNPLPVKAKARLVIQGQHCPDNDAQGLARTDAPTAHQIAVSVLLQLISSVGCRSLRGGCFLCLSARKTARS